MAYLEIETREGSRTVRLDRERLSIGRLSYNDVVLPYAQVSRQHAELRCIQGQWWIADLHSTNGLQMDSMRIQEHALRPGDRIVLAPGVSIRFVRDGQPPDAGSPADARSSSHPNGSASYPPQRQPTTPASPEMGSPQRPRSVFSDDEEPFIPPGHAQKPTAWPPAGAPLFPGSSAPGRNPSPPPSYGNDNPSQRATMGPSSYGSNGSSPAHNGSGASDAFHRSDPGAADPFRRSAPHGEARSPVPSGAAKLLHVCQTCGQLTTPDSVYCQSCHHSIARECPTCQLSLLPIQERCPRCQTANAFSVRRTRPGREG